MPLGILKAMIRGAVFRLNETVTTRQSAEFNRYDQLFPFYLCLKITFISILQTRLIIIVITKLIMLMKVRALH